jgi:hypothetical protein
MSSAQLAAVSYMTCYAIPTACMPTNTGSGSPGARATGWNPLVGIQRAHVELYVRQLGDQRLMDASVVTMMPAVRGYLRFAHIDGVIGSDPAVYARVPKVHRDESRTQGLERLELISFSRSPRTDHQRPPRRLGLPRHQRPARLPRRQRYGSRTAPTPCAVTGSSTCSGSGTSPPPCR